jgi:hypothetical protein
MVPIVAAENSADLYSDEGFRSERFLLATTV